MIILLDNFRSKEGTALIVLNDQETRLIYVQLKFQFLISFKTGITVFDAD